MRRHRNLPERLEPYTLHEQWSGPESESGNSVHDVVVILMSAFVAFALIAAVVLFDL